MSWSWTYDPAAEGLPQDSFGSQSDAESWLGENWRQLYDGGVRTVTLVHDGTAVYPMSLEPAG